jgi:hypothetical protein
MTTVSTVQTVTVPDVRDYAAGERIETDCGIARPRPVQPGQRPPTRIYADAGTIVTRDGVQVGQWADLDDYGVFWPNAHTHIELTDMAHLSIEDRLRASSAAELEEYWGARRPARCTRTALR